MTTGGVGRRAAADGAVRRLRAASAAGPLSRAQVAAVARSVGVSDRTVWRWMTLAADQVQAAARPRFALDEDMRERWRP